MIYVALVIASWLVFAFGYFCGHEVGYSKARWDRTEQIDRLLGCDDQEPA